MTGERFNLIMDVWSSIRSHPATLRALQENRVAVHDATVGRYLGAKITRAGREPPTWDRRDYLYYTVQDRAHGYHWITVIVCEGLEVEVIHVRPMSVRKRSAAA